MAGNPGGTGPRGQAADDRDPAVAGLVETGQRAGKKPGAGETGAGRVVDASAALSLIRRGRVPRGDAVGVRRPADDVKGVFDRLLKLIAVAGDLRRGHRTDLHVTPDSECNWNAGESAHRNQ